jgi:hypothetical protein
LIVDVDEIPDMAAAEAKGLLEQTLGYRLKIARREKLAETVDAWTQYVRRLGRDRVVALCVEDAGLYGQRAQKPVDAISFFLPMLSRVIPPEANP